ncbi:MAG: glycosyltransferase family 2 protein [Halioglobus sp.]
MVSVVIPAYNCQELVGEALRSVLEQTHANLEILVADDGSTDQTRMVIDSFRDARIKACHNEKNLGYLRTVNRLLGLATGEYLCFQDADDWSAPDRVALQLQAVIAGQKDACGTGIYYTDLRGKLLERVIYPVTSQEVRRCMLEGRPSACYASILFSRKVLTTVGGYREFFSSGAEDIDWLLRLVEKHDYINIADPLYFYRFSPSSITQSTNILKQKASLQVARELAQTRAMGEPDELEAGQEALLRRRWESLSEELGRYVLAEDLHKINRLLRRRALLQCAKLCIQVLHKEAPLKSKIAVISSAALKAALGMERYNSIKASFRNLSVKAVD